MDALRARRGASSRMYVLRLGFLDGRAGFVLARSKAYYVFLKYAKLWELARATAAKRP